MRSQGRDLGTYYLRVEFDNHRGYIEEWFTGHRYTHGRGEHSPLYASMITPTWESEEALESTMIFQYVENNYSCDCNRALFEARAYQEDEPEDPACGDTYILRRLTMIRPDMSEKIIWDLDRVAP